MRKFALSLLFILTGLFIVDRLGAMVMWWVNQHTNDVSGPKIRYLINDVHEDLVLMGTSRCNLHYVPSIISDTLGLSVYNGGIDASNNIYAHYIMLNHILAIHKPKMICLEVMTSDFEIQKDPFTTVSYFAPYFGLNENADSVFRLADKYWIYRISHLYRYNAKAASNIAGLIISRQSGGENGYIPLPEPESHPDEPVYFQTPQKIDSTKIEYVQRFINLCKNDGVKLVFVVSPSYTRVDADYYDVLKNIAHKNDIPFLDYHTTQLFISQPDLFKDNIHLWDKGARLYSSVFASDLKHFLEN